MQKWIILIIVVLITIMGIYVVLNVDVETEYVPEAEVEDIELRKTIVSLYFKDSVSQEIVKETRMIDSKELLKNPYKTLIELLIKGSENTNYEKVIPEETKIIEVSCENGCVNIIFSKEFSENRTQEQQQISLDIIKQTLIELTEVTDVKILVEGGKIES